MSFTTSIAPDWENIGRKVLSGHLWLLGINRKPIQIDKDLMRNGTYNKIAKPGITLYIDGIKDNTSGLKIKLLASVASIPVQQTHQQMLLKIYISTYSFNRISIT